MAFWKRPNPTLKEVAEAAPGSRLVVGDTGGVIRGTLHFGERRDTWVEHQVHADDGTWFWLAIEEQDELVAIRWDMIDADEVVGAPGDRTVSMDGVEFRRYEEGSVGFTSTGLVDGLVAGIIAYSDYESPDGRLLSFERYDTGMIGGTAAEWEAAVGRHVKASVRPLM